jgi:hypothetical protein
MMKIRMAAAMLAALALASPARAQDGQCLTTDQFASAVQQALPAARLLDHPLGAEATAIVAAMNEYGAPRPLVSDELLVVGHPDSPLLLVAGFLGGCGVWQARMKLPLYEMLRRAALGVAG